MRGSQNRASKPSHTKPTAKSQMSKASSRSIDPCEAIAPLPLATVRSSLRNDAAHAVTPSFRRESGSVVPWCPQAQTALSARDSPPPTLLPPRHHYRAGKRHRAVGMADAGVGGGMDLDGRGMYPVLRTRVLLLSCARGWNAACLGGLIIDLRHSPQHACITQVCAPLRWGTACRSSPRSPSPRTRSWPPCPTRRTHGQH